MKKIVLILNLIICTSITSWASPLALTIANNQQSSTITATITKETTDDQFNNLKAYFKDQGIEITIKKVKRNSENQITGLNLNLEKDNQQSSYNSHSNRPIEAIELGYKDGNVFIGNVAKSFSLSDNNSLSSLLNNLSENTPSIDSLLSQNQFSFGSEDIRKLLKESSFDFDQLQEQLFNQLLSFGEEQSSVTPSKTTKSSIPKYSFFNNGKIKKLIIIDGEEAAFETLDALAKADKIEEVDNLQPTTAISIYGDKGKDGAIIAVTKK